MIAVMKDKTGIGFIRLNALRRKVAAKVRGEKNSKW